MPTDPRSEHQSTATVRRILVADDSPSDVLLLREAFHAQAKDVVLTSVGDGLSALRRIEESPSFYNVLILDLSLPGVHGCEILNALQKLTWHPPVVVLTGSARTSDRRTCLKLGAVSYQIKPMYFGQWLQLASFLLALLPAPVAAAPATPAGPGSRPSSRPLPRSQVTA